VFRFQGDDQSELYNGIGRKPTNVFENNGLPTRSSSDPYNNAWTFVLRFEKRSRTYTSRFRSGTTRYYKRRDEERPLTRRTEKTERCEIRAAAASFLLYGRRRLDAVSRGVSSRHIFTLLSPSPRTFLRVHVSSSYFFRCYHQSEFTRDVTI